MSGISGNSSDKVVLNSIDQFTGLANMKVVAINPSKSELEKLLGLEEGKIEKELQYTDLDLQNDGNLQNKVVFHLEATTKAKEKDSSLKDVVIKTRIEFLVAPKERVSQTGKTQLVNALGQCSWGTKETILSNPNMKWFFKPPYHNAYIGEEMLLSFVRNWLNLATNDECNFADVTKIMNADVTELRGYLKQHPNNEITVYLDVTEKNNKHYQVIYGKAFSRPTAKSPETLFANAFKEQYGDTKSPFTGFELKVFYPKIEVDTPDSEQPTTKSAFL
jgi:hypothetical protein